LGNPSILEDNPYTRNNNNIRNFKTSNPSLVPAPLLNPNFLPKDISNNRIASRGNDLVYSKKKLIIYNLITFLDNNNVPNQNNATNINQTNPLVGGHGGAYHTENSYPGSQANYNSNRNNELINNFNPNQYVSQGPLDNYKNTISKGPNSPPSKVFSNYFFSHPEKNHQVLNNKAPNSGNIKPDGSDFIK